MTKCLGGKTGRNASRRVFVKVKDVAKFQYVPLANHDWLTIQTKLGKPLSNNARKELSEITRKFSYSSRSADESELLAVISKKLDLWRSHTKSLQKLIWPNGTLPNPNEATDDLSAILKKYFDDDPSELEVVYPLAFLHRFLNGAVATSLFVESVIADPHHTINRDVSLWLLWATYVFSVLKRANIPRRHKSRKQLLPGPVFLLEKLQTTLPATLRRRNSKSLHKAAIEAFKGSIDSKATMKTMSQLLVLWGTGFHMFGSSPDGTGDFGFDGVITRLQERVDRLTKPKSRRMS